MDNIKTNYLAHIYKAGGVIILGEKVLVARSKDKDFFVTPGGKIEAGETPKEALARELLEELRIIVKEQDMVEFGTYSTGAVGGSHKKLRMDAFLVKSWSGQIEPDNEIEEVKWLGSDIPVGVKIGSIMEKEIIPKLKSLKMID